MYLQNSFQWDENDSALIQKNWKKIYPRRLSNTFCRDKVKYENSCSPWIELQPQKQLLSHRSSRKSHHLQKKKKKKKRSLAGTSHTGRLIFFTQHEDCAVNYCFTKIFYMFKFYIFFVLNQIFFSFVKYNDKNMDQILNIKNCFNVSMYFSLAQRSTSLLVHVSKRQW